MPAQPSSKLKKAVPNPSPNTPSKATKPKIRSAATMAARRQASARYRNKLSTVIWRKSERRREIGWHDFEGYVKKLATTKSMPRRPVLALGLPVVHIERAKARQCPRPPPAHYSHGSIWQEIRPSPARRQQLEARRAEAQERTDFARYEAEYQMRLQQQHSGTST
ncbi:hypothetical protein C8F04DRAFT_1200658 [Mycena alexandri]|uniref:Uncharacterized protein n=1 Tax=Mycena alexandri TaxID=1745969 RepID=A0AAD6RXQ1_9AGAR|nr:hypothetical protein C8F04DRAFT_1200658 [Mycena alexandri]